MLLAQMGAATRAASEAASAAAKAVQTKAGIGAGDMSKILPRPDVFSPKNREEEHSQWMNWLWSLKQYMTALDTEYSNDFARIEAYSTVAIDTIASPEAVQRSQRLYALLAGLVRGRGLQIIQRVPSQNGYEALRQLIQLFQPTSRTRSLGILTALTQVHSFKSSEPLLAQLLELERMCDEYEKASSKSLDDDFKTSILLKCITGPMKSHLATILTEHATYAEIREAALRYERMQQKWTPSSLFSHEFGGSRGSREEPIPMEVDRLGKGPKGKDPKGKGRGNKGKDSKGKGKWNNNSKGKGDWNKDSKGKGKGGKDKGGNKAQWPQVCGWCQKPGHFKRDCFQYKAYMEGRQKGARQVSSAASEAGASTTASTVAPSSASALHAQQQQHQQAKGPAGSQSAVRRVWAEPVVFDMSEMDDPFPYEPTVRMITVSTAPESFMMDCQDYDDDWTEPPGDYRVLNLCPEEVSDLCDLHLQAFSAVRTVRSSQHNVIIDSGADVSCIPAQFQECGHAARVRPIQVQDAQGGSMQVQSERLVEFVFDEGPQPLVIREGCIVANVTQPLLSLGRLMRKGWWPVNEGTDYGGGDSMSLRHNKSGAQIPLAFKGYSLAVQAKIRRVEFEDDVQSQYQVTSEVQSPQVSSDDVQSQDQVTSEVQSPQVVFHGMQSHQVTGEVQSPQVVFDEVQSHQVTGEVQSPQVVSDIVHVQAIQVRVQPDTLDKLEYGWQIGPVGHLVWRGRTSRFVDPSMFAPIGWPFRTTLMQRNGTWFLLEHCVPWYDIVNVEAVLPGEQVAEVVTFLHVRKEPVCEIGVQLPAGMAEPEGLPEPKFYSFVRESEHAPVGTIDREVPEDEAMAGFEDSAGQLSPDKPAQVPLPDQVESGVPTGDAEPLTLDGVLIDQDSSLAVLKAAAAKLNLSTAGSRSRLYARVRSYVEKQKLALELELAGDAQGLSERPPRVQPAPREPTDAERLLHECTHLPFAPWCDHCIAMRAVPDRSEHLVQGPRDVPVVQFDFCFTGYSLQDGMHGLDGMPDEAQRALKWLVTHDSATGSIAAIPCEAKGDTRYLGIELMRFIQGLGHNSICLKCDNEPSTLTLQRAIVTARQRLGLKTTVQNPAIGAKGSLGFCEKAIDSVRRLANTLLDQARHRTGLPIPTSHILFPWSFIHAAWLLNRYRPIGNLTPYERVYGARYSGRIAPFAEPVYCQLDVRQKGDKRWVLSVLVGKASLNDMYIVSGRDGIRLSRSIRRVGRPWATEVQLYRELKGYPWDYGSGVIGTKFVPMPKQRPPEVEPLPSGAPRSPDEAATEPPTPMDRGVPATPVGGAPSLMPPPSAIPVPSVPPPESARSKRSGAGQEMQELVGPNPSMRPDSPSTPEATLPPLSPVVRMDTTTAAETTAPDTPRATKKLRLRSLKIRAVQFGDQSYEVNDEGDYDFDRDDVWEAETAIWSTGSENPSLNDDEFDDGWTAPPEEEEEAGEDDERLWFPDNGKEPKLDSAILAELDKLADQVEISRLVGKQVLREAAASDQIYEMKNLTTKFVHTWRSKKKNGVSMWYRRARLCAREFRWLDSTKEGLFSPATSTDIIRLVPALYLAWTTTKPGQKFAVISLDIKDTYLQVEQPVPVTSTIQGKPYVFERMIPGQREGSQQWFAHFVAYLGEHFHVEKCRECPAVVRLSEKGPDGSVGEHQGPGMIHVDDSLMLLPLDWALKRFIPVVQQKFQITYEVAHAPGDSFRFLKRLHCITEQGITIRQPASYIQQMQTIMNVKQNSRQRVPCWPELRNKDNTPELSIEEASKFRQAIGTALYISCDRPDVGFTVRMLAAYMSRPTEHAKTGLVKLIQYLINTCHYGICMKYAKPGTRKLHDYVADHGCSDSDDRFSLEVYSDADWSGSKKDRKSYGGASYCLNGQYIHYICRSQKSVSLSSMESEYYSAVGASCQGIFMKAVVEFMSRSPCDLTVYVDNQACKAFCLRQGVTKASKHFEGRLLWLQDVVQRKVLQMKYVSTHANLGDIHTKPLGPARMQCLLFLHDFVDDCDRSVGENEWNQAHASAMMKARVRHVKQVTGSSSSWCKKIALLLMMMPMDVEATSTTAVYKYNCVPVLAVFMVMMVCFTGVAAMESSQESANDEGWLFITARGGQVYRRGGMYAMAATLAGLLAWSLGPTPRHGVDNDVHDGVYQDTTTTTSTTPSMQFSTEYIYFAALVFFLGVMMVMSILLIKAKRVCSRQQTELAELRELCSALWDEQRDDKARLADLKKECFELSSENAALQYDILDRPQGTQTTRIPREVVITDHGRCYHHRTCGVVRNRTFRAAYPCKECVHLFGMDG